jgi:hypothetical protein
MKHGALLLAGAACTTVLTSATAFAQSGIRTLGATAFSGRAFYNLTDLNSRRNGVRQADHGPQLDLKRLYLIADHRFSKTVTANLTSDFQYDSASGQTELLIKKAYVQAQLSDALTLRAGAADTPWVPLTEGLYGSRYIERSLTDRSRTGRSTDWGVHALGDLPGEVFSYAVAVIGGGGHEEPAWTRTLDVEGRISAELGHVTLGVGGYRGRLAQSKKGGPPARHTAQRFTAVAAYVSDSWRLGAEYFTADNWNAVLAAQEDRAEGYSIYGRYNLTRTIGVQACYDEAEPNQITAPSRTARYYNIGLTYSPTPTLDVALLYKRDESQSTSVPIEREVDEVGFWGQVRF